jgi:inner membrane protein
LDPISQGALGASFAQTLKTKDKMLAATWLGCAAGMAPDLDVLIQSAQDPLLFLEFHRHFTHALLFIPFGAAIVASALHYFARKRLRFRETYLVCLIGYATHGLLDACTSYGTQLFWPFSDMRVAWNNVSVVDPAFTVPLVILTIAAYRSQRHLYTYLGIGWAIGYLLLGFVQMERATTAAHELAQTRGHTPTQLSMKPSFANLLIWKSIYAHDGYYYVDAVRTGTTPTVCPGSRIEKLDIAKHLPELETGSQQASDLERFRWFSMDYLAPTGKPGEVMDMRYSMVPNQIAPMWGITLDTDTDMNAHVQWWSRRDTSSETIEAFEALLMGEGCEKI